MRPAAHRDRVGLCLAALAGALLSLPGAPGGSALLPELRVLSVSEARADWLQPDASYREAQFILRMAARDTAGHADDPGRLDSLGVALLRLGRMGQAEKIFRHVLDLSPRDELAHGALGKLALFNDRLAEAESLLAGAEHADPIAMNDLFAARIRRGEYAAAAAMAAEVNQEGRTELLKRMAEQPPYQITAGPKQAKLVWNRAYPVPLVRVKLNGQSVLMALDTGANDLLLDESAARRCKVERLPAQHAEFWCGARIAVKNAMVQRLEISGLKVEHIPAGILSLHKWSLEVNPQSEAVVGVIGFNFFRRFTPTLDYKNQRLELRQPEVAFVPGPDAERVPFEIWGESELTVYGSLAQSRRMALVVQSGVPGCGVGAPTEVFDEIGVRPGIFSRATKGMGQFLHGRPWSAVTVASVTVGPIAKDKVAGWVGALDASELWRHGVRRDALIAGDFFRGRRVTIDWKGRELIFEE